MVTEATFSIRDRHNLYSSDNEFVDYAQSSHAPYDERVERSPAETCCLTYHKIEGASHADCVRKKLLSAAWKYRRAAVTASEAGVLHDTGSSLESSDPSENQRLKRQPIRIRTSAKP